jgi:alpha/beta superfamily hydrolase
VTFRTADGLRLAGELSYPADVAPAGVAWIANPHPFMGGTMDNNVVRALADPRHAASRAGWAVLRFDYRGVGMSEGHRSGGELADNMSAFLETGHAPDDLQMLADVAAADAFCHRELGDLLRAGIGYSFGAYLLSERLRDLQDCRRGGSLNGHDLSAAVAICPTLTSHDFCGLARSTHRRLLVCADDDFATPPEAIRSFINHAGGIESHWFSGVDHFFKGKEAHVAHAAGQFLADTKAERREAV